MSNTMAVLVACVVTGAFGGRIDRVLWAVLAFLALTIDVVRALM